MAELFTIENFLSLLMLILLQAVLGFDNLLYISLESQRAPKEKQKYVRQLGIGLAIIFRIGLLFALLSLIDAVAKPIFAFNFPWTAGTFTLHSLIVLAGGGFIIYTAVKEIFHMMMLNINGGLGEKPKKSVASVIFWIVLMNLVFSFDSILSAMALTHVKTVMATAIVIGGVLMIWMSEKVANFLQKNRMYELLGLFVLLLVGIMLLSEGGHLAQLMFFGQKVQAMTKTTFYFVLAVVILTHIGQSRYQKRLLAEQDQRAKEGNQEA